MAYINFGTLPDVGICCKYFNSMPDTGSGYKALSKAVAKPMELSIITFHIISKYLRFGPTVSPFKFDLPHAM